MSGEQTAFLNVAGKRKVYRPVPERLYDYHEVEPLWSYTDVIEQAGRCMDCGTPFCHAFGCPLANVIPEVNRWAFAGKWREALYVLQSTNNFPEFTGRVCPAPCEAACVAGVHTDPVTIRQIELAVVERGFESGFILPSPPAVRLDKSVAVIGAGPAGLAAADSLNRAGVRVTVFDEGSRPGGILRYGIPDFKLEKWVLDRRIRLMEAEGVVFEPEVKVDRDISHGYLSRRFDAVCLAFGSRRPRDISIPGRDLTGIHFAMDYLRDQNKRLSGESGHPSSGITATGKNVVVIGGGDTGSDCLGTALRQGAASVVQMEIMPKPPDERSPSTPWPMWPWMLRSSHAHEEGGRRLWEISPVEFRGDGGVKKVVCRRVSWEVSMEGLPLRPVEIAGSDIELNADFVLVAAGYLGPEPNRIIERLDLALDNRGNVLGSENRMTNVPGIFAAGDVRSGQSLVVKAIMDGRAAARGILRYFRNGRIQNDESSPCA
jgi:glutamate synthase (NADPH) small chain